MGELPTPALQYLLTGDALYREVDGMPSECCDCPFGMALDEPYPPNPSDPGEGYYYCDLLDVSGIWGENPQCQISHWRTRARVELRLLLREALAAREGDR